MLGQEELTAALKTFGEAVPAGTKLHSLKIIPSVVNSDSETNPVFVFVLADIDKDVEGLSEAISRGIEAFETESGLTASLIRDQPITELFTEAAAQMSEEFSPRVHTAPQDRADLERLYPKGVDGEPSVINTDDEIVLKTVLKDQDGKRERLRLLALRVFVPLVILSAILVAAIAITISMSKAVAVGLALYPPLTAAWYFSTPDMVHGPKFREMRRSAQINTGLRIAGLVMSAAAFFYAVPTLF